MCEVTWLDQKSRDPDVMETGWLGPRIPPTGSLTGHLGENRPRPRPSRSWVASDLAVSQLGTSWRDSCWPKVVHRWPRPAPRGPDFAD